MADGAPSAWASSRPLLSDTGNKVARQFRLVYRVPEEQEAIYRRAFVNLPLVNGDDSWQLPIPAIYVLDSDGSVLLAEANADYIERPEPAQIVQFLRAAIVKPQGGDGA